MITDSTDSDDDSFVIEGFDECCSIEVIEDDDDSLCLLFDSQMCIQDDVRKTMRDNINDVSNNNIDNDD